MRIIIFTTVKSCFMTQIFIERSGQQMKCLPLLFFLAPLVLFPHLEKYPDCRLTFIYPSHLLLLSLSEVILDVERLPDLLGSLSLDHVGHSLAGHIQESLIKWRQDMI